MLEVSVVVITKNEEKNICDCIRSAQQITNDVIIVDCGSSDDTVSIAQAMNANVVSIDWKCYGHSRNTGAEAARHKWILSLDADERLTSELVQQLHLIDLRKKDIVYRISRTNHFAGKKLRFGAPGFDRPSRLYHKEHASWNLNLVHERLVTNASWETIRQPLLHYSIKDKEQYRNKMLNYAELSARNYLQHHKKATAIKRYISPFFNAFKSYVLQLGFLDGREGWVVAKTIGEYTWLKYRRLEQLQFHASLEPAPRMAFKKPAPQHV